MGNRLKNEAENFHGPRTIIIALAVIAASFILAAIIPPVDPENPTIVACVPAIFLIVYIFTTKRILEALFLASIVGLILVNPTSIMGSLSTTMTEVMMDEDTGWLIIVCGLMGSIMTLIERAGGAIAFGDWVSKRCKTRKGTLMWTWFLGVIIFIDDYLNSLTVGSCMSSVTDRYKVSREYLSYIVSSTAAPLCVLIPISTWAVFAGRILESSGWASLGDGVLYFIKTIPFNFYGWIAAIMVPCVIYGIIPMFGPMKKAEDRVANGGPLAPPGSESIDMHAGEEAMPIPEKPSVWNFFLPIICLIAATIICDVDMQSGVIITLIFMFALYMFQNLMSASEFADLCVKGIKNMVLPLMLMVLAFIFANMNEQIGFTYYVITTGAKIMTPALMPVMVFILLACTEFITGTNWGMYIIALPIVVPLATELGVNMPLAVAAVLSAGVFGSHVCFYSDCTVITSSATGCNNFDHAYTQATFGVLAAVISAILFLIAGFVFA